MADAKKAISRSKSEKYATSNKIRNLRLQNLKHHQNRNDSFGVIEELVQCGICLEKLVDPRMLPCQHTFCLVCLRSQLIAKNLANNSNPANQNCINCPVCQSKVTFDKGLTSLESLPKNLYINSLLKVVEGGISPSLPKTANNDFRCVKCQIISEQEEHICQHCLQVFCNVCWTQHLSELESNLLLLTKQIEESEIRLEHKLENFENRCEQINEIIEEATERKIEEIKQMQKSALNEVESLKEQGRITYDIINTQLQELKEKLKTKSVNNRINKASTFMNLHNKTSKLLNQVHHYGEVRLIFDPITFKLDQDTEGIYNDVEDNETINGVSIGSPLNNVEAMKIYYKTRSFNIPKLIWNKCPRPASVAVPPWDPTKIYVAATDTHTVLILDKNKFKLVGRLTSSELLCPHGLAFSEKRQEIYVSDKWKHCIHVFSQSGEYLTRLCSKGSGLGKIRSPDGLAVAPNEKLIICDSGNDRIVILDLTNETNFSTIGVINGKTNLNMPTGVAVFGDQIIIADTGNHRIKTFDMDGTKLQEFGSLGRNRGQFRSAEVVAVDSSGFILVGDGGNARIQVFQPDGTLVKIFGNNEFGWVSGIFVTSEMNIITTDGKRRTLRIF